MSNSTFCNICSL